MTIITATAVYKDGVLKPAIKLDLPEDTAVQVQIVPLLAASQSTPTPFGLLKGIWSHLSDSDLEQMEQALDEGRRQSSEKVKRLARELG